MAESDAVLCLRRDGEITGTVGSRLGLMEDNGDKAGIIAAIDEGNGYASFLGCGPESHWLGMVMEKLALQPSRKISDSVSHHLDIPSRPRTADFLTRCSMEPGTRRKSNSLHANLPPKTSPPAQTHHPSLRSHHHKPGPHHHAELEATQSAALSDPLPSKKREDALPLSCHSKSRRRHSVSTRAPVVAGTKLVKTEVLPSIY